MVQAKLLAMGHSHIGAIYQAHKKREEDGSAHFENIRFVRFNYKVFRPNFEIVNNVRQLTVSLERRIKHIIKKEEPEAIFLTVMGNEYNTIGMLQHPEPFDFDWPEFGLVSDPSKTNISFDMIKSQMEFLTGANAIQFLKSVNQHAKCPIYVMPPAPPIADEAHIKSFPGAFGERIKEYGLSPAEFRLKMWLLYCHVLEEFCKKSGLVFIESPFEARDEGYLAKPYWSKDPTHGNIAFGEIVINNLIKAVTKTSKEMGKYNE